MGRLFHQTKIRRRLFVFWVPGIFALLPQRARAATELASATLEVKAAAGAENCPNAEALRDQTAKLGTPPETPRAPLHVQVEFRANGAGYQSIVRTSGRTEGTRELVADGPSCEPVAAATAVFLAVLLDLLPPSEASAARAEATVARAAPSENAPPAASESAPALLGYASVGARSITGYGLLGPALSASFGGEARLRLGPAELELGGFGGPARSIDYAPGSVDLSLAAGHVAVCGYLDASVDRLELGACATLFLGQLLASGAGFYEDRQVSAFWIAGGIGATVAVPLARHWALRFGLDMIVPFRNYTLEVERIGIVFESTPVGLALAFGPEFRFR